MYIHKVFYIWKQIFFYFFFFLAKQLNVLCLVFGVGVQQFRPRRAFSLDEKKFLGGKFIFQNFGKKRKVECFLCIFIGTIRWRVSIGHLVLSQPTHTGHIVVSIKNGLVWLGGFLFLKNLHFIHFYGPGKNILSMMIPFELRQRNRHDWLHCTGQMVHRLGRNIVDHMVRFHPVDSYPVAPIHLARSTRTSDNPVWKRAPC